MYRKITVLVVIMWISFGMAVYADNPVIKDRFSADPAALVHDGKVYLYTGHDEAQINGNFFVLKEWNVFSSSNLENWELEGSLSRNEFNWAKNDSAWASQAIERDGQFYWYVTVFNNDPNEPGYAIGVAQSDHPAEGFKDAIGEPLISPSMTEDPEHMGTEPWDDIDPTVFIDDDGQAYMYWGNTHLYYAKLKDNMIELDGAVNKIEIEKMVDSFTEGPWIHKYEEMYYLTFAVNYPEEIGYAMSDNPEGPWEYKGKLMEKLPGSSTSHPAIIEFEGEWYFIYHTAALPTGGEFRRSVSMEKMNYNPDGTIQKVIPTATGINETSYTLQAYGEDELFVRHKGMGIQADPMKEEHLDYKWHVVPGLVDENEAYVSFQSENKPGFYLKRKGQNIIIAKHDGTEDFKESATFISVQGLADKTWSSYQAYNDKELYLTVDEKYQLGLSDNSSTDSHENLTFRLLDNDGVQVNKAAEKGKTDNFLISFHKELLIGIVLILFIGAFLFIVKRKKA